MNDKQQELLMDHEYDGIREYDNPTPGWWTWLFIGSCVFAVGYGLFFHFSVYGWSVHERYEEERMANEMILTLKMKDFNLSESELLSLMGDPAVLAAGEKVFAAQCATCHGKSGEGLAGPNLTDDHYLVVKTLEDLSRVVMDGSPKNVVMQGFRYRMGRTDLANVTAYVASMRGRNVPPGVPTAPKGEVIPPWPKGSVPAAQPNAPAPMVGGQ